MPDETHKLQKDPPESSRKVVERELERQEAGPKGSEDAGKTGGEAPEADRSGRG